MHIAQCRTYSPWNFHPPPPNPLQDLQSLHSLYTWPRQDKCNAHDAVHTGNRRFKWQCHFMPKCYQQPHLHLGRATVLCCLQKRFPSTSQKSPLKGSEHSWQERQDGWNLCSINKYFCVLSWELTNKYVHIEKTCPGQFEGQALTALVCSRHKQLPPLPLTCGWCGDWGGMCWCSKG